MPSLLTSLPAVAFPHELDRLTFQAASPARVTIEVDYWPVLDVTLTPAGGRIELHSLFTLINDATQSAGLHVAPCTVSIDGQQCAALTLYPCRQRLNLKAADVIDRYFLTPALARWRTYAPGATVSLTWAATDTSDEALTVTTLWSDRATAMTATTVTRFVAERPDDDEAFRTVTILPRQLTRPDELHTWVPARLEAACGERRLTLVAAPTAEATAPVTMIDYTNQFGARDQMALLGTCTEEEKNTYLAASIAGRLRTIMVTPEPHTKGQTGTLLEGDIVCLRDLALATDVTIGGEPVVITALDFKRDTAHHAAPSATLQWEPSRRDRFQAARPKGGVFDDTFDDSYE